MSFLLTGSFSQTAQNSAGTGKTVEVQGTVVDATSNDPIRKAFVILRKGEDAGVGTYTDDAGKFVLHEVESGTYVISAERSGFVADPKAPQHTVIVSSGEPLDPIVLKLNRTGAISGNVVDASGEPVAGASIQLQPLNPKKNQPVVGYATSDDRGTFRAYNIPPGKYKLSVTYSFRREDPRVRIQIEKDKNKDASSDAYGTTYYPDTLDPAQATTIQVESGSDIQGIDITLHHTKAVRVRGKVSGADGELTTPLVMVMLSPLNGGNSADTQIRPDGSFELNEVTPGKYLLSAMGLLQQGKQLAATQPLEVSEADIDGIQLTLGRAQNISGTLLMPPDRKLPSGLVVVLQSREKLGPHFAGQSGGFAQIGEHGTFSIENVLPGDYDFLVASLGKGDDLYVASIRAGDQDVLASGLHVGAGVVPHVELAMKANGAEIDCTVLDDKQTPIPGARVTLLPDPPRRSQLALHAECQTDASGKCSLLGVAPGDYHAFAIAKDDSLDLENPDKPGNAVTVVLGDHKSLQLALVPSEN